MVLDERATRYSAAVSSDARNRPACNHVLILSISCASSGYREVERSVLALLRADVRRHRFRAGATISNLNASKECLPFW